MLFNELLNELDQLLQEAGNHPTHAQVARFGELVQDATLRQYGFEHLSEPAWLRLLQAAGLFASPPSPVHDEATKTTSFPFWSESRYLARMAPRDPAAVAEIIQTIPATANMTVNEDLAEAALGMPPAWAARLLPQAKQWAESAGGLGLPETLGKLVVHLAEGGQTEAALELARSLLTLLPDPRAAEHEAEGEVYRLPPEPRARFETYDYEQIVTNCLPALTAADSKATFEMFCGLLDATVDLSRRRHDDEDGAEDYSYIWRPSIEQTDQGARHGLKDILVSAVRDTAEHALRSNQTTTSEIVQSLEARRWRIFHRFALHFLRRFPGEAAELIAARLTKRDHFAAVGMQREYRALLKDHFQNLESRERETILGWIDEGPNLALFAENYKHWRGQEPTDEEQRQFADAWRRDWLACVVDALPEDWRLRYDRLVAELGQSEPLEVVSRTAGGFVGPTSPKTAEDLQSMTAEGIAEFFRTWEPTGRTAGFMDAPTPEGLGRAFQTLVGNHPAPHASAAPLFQDLDPTYVRSLVAGLREAVSQDRQFDWSPVLTLCRWVVQQPYSLPPLEGTWLERDPGWGWTRGAIADLLYSGFEQRDAECPFVLRTEAFTVLEPLTDDPEPTPEYEARYGGSNMDPATLSLNTTRGKAMHALVRYGLWVRRHLGAEGSETTTFTEMPEVPRVLDLHLDPAIDPALAVRAVYGQWFPWLVTLDRSWSEHNVPRIFPHEPGTEALLDAAWSTYMRFCQPFDVVLEVLRSEYGRAVERIRARTADDSPDGPNQRLAEHLMVFYWRGRLDLEQDGLISRFYQVAPGALRGHSLSFTGRSLRNTTDQVPAHIISRLKALWEWRLRSAADSGSPGSYAAELAAFGWWFVCPQFDSQWLLMNLHEALRLLAQTDPLERVRLEPQRDAVKRLADLTPNAPVVVVRCLGYLVESDREGWRISHWRETALTILDTAIKSGDTSAREEAIQLADRLVARGFYGFREVIPVEAERTA
jgi:hypothetical protein